MISCATAHGDGYFFLLPLRSISTFAPNLVNFYPKVEKWSDGEVFIFISFLLVMSKIELSENRRLQVAPTGSVVLVTCGHDERANIITVGMYMPISVRPPLVCIGIAPQRYSHQLIEETGEFVVNSP